MAAQPAPHRAPATRPRPQARRESAARLELRRRRRHLQRLRRDALLDAIVALALTIFILIATAGLGVVCLLEIPVAGVVVASFVLERRRRRRVS